jgi:hypothetical protein
VENVRERLKRLNLTEEMLLDVEKTIVSLQMNEDSVNNLLSLLEKVSLQHYIREFLKQNMLR